MKRNFFFLQYKIRMGILLTVLIAAIVANNLWFTRNIKHMDSAANSIYQDRLMAATYISELTHLLYIDRLEMSKGNDYRKAGGDAMLLNLIAAYDSTMLTKQERIYWNAFKKSLHLDNGNIAAGFQEHDLDMALQNLQLLNKIQASEGSMLIRNIRQDINSASIGLILEITIAIIIGLLVLTLLGISKDTILAADKKASLN